jgi:preprotein translocase subunit SecE
MLRKAWNSSAEFLKEVRGELERVSYPSREETTGSTIVVILFVVIVSIFLAFTDSLLTKFVRQIF